MISYGNLRTNKSFFDCFFLDENEQILFTQQNHTTIYLFQHFGFFECVFVIMKLRLDLDLRICIYFFFPIDNILVDLITPILLHLNF